MTTKRVFGLIVVVLVVALSLIGLSGRASQPAVAQSGGSCHLIEQYIDPPEHFAQPYGKLFIIQVSDFQFPDFTVQDVLVDVEMEGYDAGNGPADIAGFTLSLEHGSVIQLMDGNAQSGSSYAWIEFDDRAPVQINEAEPPFIGNYRSVESLSAFRGIQAHGLWILDANTTQPITDGWGKMLYIGLWLCEEQLPLPTPTPTPTPPPVCPPLPAGGFGFRHGAIASVHYPPTDQCFNLYAEDSVEIAHLTDAKAGNLDPSQVALWFSTADGDGPHNFNAPYSWHPTEFAWGELDDHGTGDPYCGMLDGANFAVDPGWPVCLPDVEVVEIMYLQSPSSGAQQPQAMLQQAGGEYVTVRDIVEIARRIGAVPGDPLYATAYDLIENNQIDVQDIQIRASQWRQPVYSPGLVLETSELDIGDCNVWQAYYHDFNLVNNTGSDQRYWAEIELVNGTTARGPAVELPAGASGVVSLTTYQRGNVARVYVEGDQAAADATTYNGLNQGCLNANPVVLRVDGVDPYPPEVMQNAVVLDITSGDPLPLLITESQLAGMGWTQAQAENAGLNVVPDGFQFGAQLLEAYGYGDGGNSLLSPEQIQLTIPVKRFGTGMIFEVPPKGHGLIGALAAQLTLPLPERLSTVAALIKVENWLEQLWKGETQPHLAWWDWVRLFGTLPPQELPGTVCLTATFWVEPGGAWGTFTTCPDKPFELAP